MTRFEKCWGIHTGKGSFGSKIASANRKEGDRVGGSEYRNKVWRVMTHMEAMGLHVGHYPPHPVSVL